MTSSETGRGAPWPSFGAAILLATLAAAARVAAALTALEVNEASFRPDPPKDGIDPAVLRAQVLLDRLRFSPGSIDGRPGDNFRRALSAFETANGMPATDALAPEVYGTLVATYPGPVLVPYTTTAEDLKGPFLEKIPRDFEDMAALDHMGYASAREELAERFHVSPALLAALNPDAGFRSPGEILMVAAARPDPDPAAISNRNAVPAEGGTARVVRIEIDNASLSLRAFDADNKLVAYYPATIGSEEKPAPTGRFAIRALARNPTYTYDRNTPSRASRRRRS